MNTDITQQTLDLIKSSLKNPLNKAGITVSTGLVQYSLEAGAKLLYPVLTPFRNIIPRVTGVSGTAEHWKAITGVNTTGIRAGVGEGNRNAPLVTTEVEYTATYKGIGQENVVTFEADYASVGFEDVRALATMQTLQALMIEEEKIILNGNTSLALGTTPTPTNVVVAGGSITASATNYVYCVALTYWAFLASGGAQNPVPNTGTLLPTVTRTNADASTDTFGGGVAQISAASSAFTTVSSNLAVTSTVTPVKGAFGYAWFLGASSGAGNAYLAAITSLPTVTLTAAATSTYAANATGLNTDNSTCALEFDGLITTCLKLNGYYKSMAGTTLTADGAGGIVEIDTMLKYFWDNYKLSPEILWVDSQCLRDISKKITSGSTNPSYKITLNNDKGSLGNVTGGSLVTTYLNKYGLNGAHAMDIKLHPNMPTGTIYADLSTDPYGISPIGAPRRIKARKEYYETVWPLRSRKFESGVYADEMLQVYMAFGTGLITDVLPG
jgi:hypothetical protein